MTKGWGGEQLLDAFDIERRAAADKNMAMVEKASLEMLLPLVTSVQRYDKDLLMADSDEGNCVRKDIAKTIDRGYWIHHQDGVTLGHRYSNSPIVVHEEGPEPESEIYSYTPTTWPGGRPPHVFLRDGQSSIFDLLGKGFNVVDFTSTGALGSRLMSIAKEMDIPMDLLHLPEETHAREMWQNDVVLLRPDHHVCWRCPEGGAERMTGEKLRRIMGVVSGHGKKPVLASINGGIRS